VSMGAARSGRGQWTVWGPGELGVGEADAEELARFDLNDYGNAMRFIRRTGGAIDEDGLIDTGGSRVLYLRRRGWIAFNGRFWDLEHGEGLARREAAKVALTLHPQLAIRVEIAKERGDSAKTIQAIWDFGVQCGNNGRVTALLNMAQAYLEAELGEFDTDPLAINCENGVVRLRRDAEGGAVARFREGHEPGDRMTRMVAAPYDPTAAAPLFDQVVRDAQPRPEDQHYLQKVLGYATTGSVEEQKFWVFQGRGGDGKSTIVNAVRDTLGSYATVVAVETFLDTGVKRGSEASPDIAALAGDTRFLSAGEPPSGSKLATGQIKAFTGDGKLKARELREGLFEFKPMGKVVIECNRRPAINDTDDGIWRRLKTLPFRHQVAPDKIDMTLPRRLAEERPGIFAWLVQGALAWMDESLRQDPESVREAVEDYRKGSNPFAQWMDARLVRDPEARVRASVLFEDYKKWCEDNGHEKPMSQRAFGGALGELHIVFAGKDGDGKVTRRGARLRTSADPDTRADDAGAGAGGSLGSEPLPAARGYIPEDLR
jgi:putative DNA primase/helicase